MPGRQRKPSPAWFDEQYDSRARIAEYRSILDYWALASAQALRRHNDVVERAYGPDPSERLDVFPAVRSHAPVLVYVHGGYWRALGKRDHTFVVPPFVDAGAMVVLPGYALCPAVSIKHIVLQMVQALVWVYRHAHEYGGDRTRIVVAGHSAGGHLATMLLSCAWRAVGTDLPSDLVKSALSISGLYELEPLRHAPFLARDLRLTPASARRLSPAYFPEPEGSLVTVVGGDESKEFHRQAAFIFSNWNNRVIASASIPGRHHMDVLHELANPRSTVHTDALRLLGLWPDANGRQPRTVWNRTRTCPDPIARRCR